MSHAPLARSYHTGKQPTDLLRAFKAQNHRVAAWTGQSLSLHRPTDRLASSAGTYEPGLVFSAHHHTSCGARDAAALDDPNLTTTPFGSVYSKYRKMVVLSLAADHCLCLPVYTCNGRGAAGKTHAHEFVGIRDCAAAAAAAAAAALGRQPDAPETAHGTLWCARAPGFDGAFVAGRSLVHLSHVYSHRYDDYATVEGRLTKRSLVRLLDLYAGLEVAKICRLRDRLAAEARAEEDAMDIEEGEIEEGEIVE